MALLTSEEVLTELVVALPPSKPMTRERWAIYLRELSDIPVDVLGVAVRELIRTSEFFPTVRAVREAAVERTLALPSEEEALRQITARMEWARDGSEGPPPPVHQLAVQALNRVGGYAAFRQSDEPGVVRGQFGRYFKELRAAKIREEQVGHIELVEPIVRRALSR